MLRGYKFRLYPTPAQEQLLFKLVGSVRAVFNAALEQRRDFWRQFRRVTGHNISFPSQCRELTDVRKELPWVGECSRTAQEQGLRDLDVAFNAFLSRKARYPKMRRRGLDDRFRLKGSDTAIRRVNGRWAEVLVPNIGRVRFRDSRPMPGEHINANFSFTAGRWHVSFACDLAAKAEAPTDSVGIDRGVVNALALSTGEMFRIPKSIARLEKRRRRAQRILARRVVGSNRRARQRTVIARLHARSRRIRTDWQHRITTDITRRFGVVSLEALNTTAMTASGPGKRNLNRAILNQGWGQFEHMLAYKLAASGGRLIWVDPAYTSQTCAACGCIDRQSRESQARFRCIHCGHEDHADRNAAINIRRASGPLLDGEGGHLGPPVEPSTLAA